MMKNNKENKGTVKFAVTAAAMAMVLATTPVAASSRAMHLDVELEEVTEDIFTDGAELESESADFGFATLEGDDVFCDGVYDDFEYPSIGPAIMMYKIELAEGQDVDITLGKLMREFEETTDLNPQLGTAMSIEYGEDSFTYILVSMTERCELEYNYVENAITVTLKTLK